MMNIGAVGLFVSFFSVSLASTDSQIFKHSWDTVGDVMGMHGKFKAIPSDDVMAFIAKTYSGMATIGTGCSGNMTMEDATIAQAKRIKAMNPKATVGMYYRSDFASELAACSNQMGIWKAHPEWRLKDDQGNLALKNGNAMMDYGNPVVADFFANTVYQYVLDAKLPTGKKVIDYIYMDGAGCSKTEYAAGIGAVRSALICTGKMNMIATLQAKLIVDGFGQNLILNGMDNVDTADLFVPTGAAGAMFDHWSILQFLNRTTGDFMLDAMDTAFNFAQSSFVSNITLQIKGWPGPIVKQRDHYPPNIPTPTTPDEFQQVAQQRFNNELAMFLLVAEDSFYWMYSWFWGWDDWIPGQSDSTVPDNFYPQAKCQLGSPKGKGTRVGSTYTYTREFEFASVFVDLTNRTNSSVTFTGAC